MSWTIADTRGDRRLTIEDTRGWVDGADVELVDGDQVLCAAPSSGSLSGDEVTLRRALVDEDGKPLRPQPGQRLRAVVVDVEPEEAPAAEDAPEPTTKTTKRKRAKEQP